MSDDNKPVKPREYLKNGASICVPVFDGEENGALENQIHLIEKSAYTALQAENARLKRALMEAAYTLDWCADKFSFVYPASVTYVDAATDKATKALGMTRGKIFNCLENQESDDE